MKKNIQVSANAVSGKKSVVTDDIEELKLLHELEVYQVELEKSNEELKRSRDEAEELFAKYSKLYDSAPVGYLSLDPGGIIHEVNLAGASIMEKERSVLLSESFYDFIPEYSRAGFRAFLEKTFTNEVKTSCEVEIFHKVKPGKIIRLEAVVDKSGPFCSAVMVDITEQKLIDDTQMFLVKAGWTSKGEDFFQSLARYLSQTLKMDYVCIDKLVEKGLLAQTIAVYYNGRFEDNVRYTLSDTPCGVAVGRRVCCFPEGVRKLFPKDQVLQEMEAESYVGTTLWDSEGNPSGLIALIGRRQIKNTRLAEAILNLVAYRAAGELERVQSMQLQNILYTISNAALTTGSLEELIAVIHENLGKLVDATNFYIALYNENTGMLSTAYFNDEKEHVNIWPAEKSLTGSIIKENRTIKLCRTEILSMLHMGRIDMVGYPAESWLGTPLSIDGRVIGAVVIQSYTDPDAFSKKDVKMLEFISSQISLSIQRKKSETEIINARIKAENSDKLKSTFLANMSHEIRTPMNAIVGFSSLLSEPGITAEEKERFAGIIQSRSDDLMHIINDILEISRIESGNANVMKNKVSLNLLLEEIELVFRQKLIKVAKENIVIKSEKGALYNFEWVT